MTIGIYDTTALNRVVEQRHGPGSFLLDAGFQEVQTHETEEVHFDVDTSKPRITPFVHPLVEGQIVESSGFTAKSFKPAYVKDKRVHRPNRALKRAIGEAIGGRLSPDQRRAINLRRDLDDQVAMMQRREGVMASEILRTGKATIVGDKYPEAIVDFGRDGALTVTLTTSARWGETGVKPLEDIESWADTVQSKSGVVPTQVVMDPEAAKLFRADSDVQTKLDNRRGGAGELELGPVARGNNRARYLGNIGDFDFWVYQEPYVDVDGTDKNMLPDNTVIMMSPAELEGVRSYGAILDEDAADGGGDLVEARYFIKSWVNKDPGVRYLLMQSAPLPVPYRVNASFCATVR